MDQTLALHPFAYAGGNEEFRSRVFQHAGADRLFAIAPAASLDDDAIDFFETQEMGEKQPGGSCAYDRDLSFDLDISTVEWRL